MNDISIVIPVYNSENTINTLVLELVRELKGEYNLELVLVNDSSSDNTGKICESLHKEFDEIIKYVLLSKNVGEHNAVLAGLNHTSGEWTVVMDDDYQNSVSEVKKLIKYALENDFDVVYTHYPSKKHSIFRNFGSIINDKAANILLNKPKDLYLSSFKALNSFVVKEIIKYDSPYPYIDGIVLRTTANIGKKEVKHSKRELGKSGYTFKKLISIWANMVTNFSVLPLRIATILGFTISITGLVFAFMVTVEKFNNPTMPLGYTSIFVSIAIFSGVQLIAIGLIGEYVGRIFLTINKKPPFVIRKILQ